MAPTNQTHCFGLLWKTGEKRQLTHPQRVGRDADPAISPDGGVLVFRMVVIAVTDNGAGIRPEQLGQLFVPFSRLGPEGGSVAGSGIGLALSQRLMGLMGGRIGVRSEPGVGSIFSVHLPAAAPP